MRINVWTQVHKYGTRSEKRTQFAGHNITMRSRFSFFLSVPFFLLSFLLFFLISSFFLYFILSFVVFLSFFHLILLCFSIPFFLSSLLFFRPLLSHFFLFTTPPPNATSLFFSFFTCLPLSLLALWWWQTSHSIFEYRRWIAEWRVSSAIVSCGVAAKNKRCHSFLTTGLLLLSMGCGCERFLLRCFASMIHDISSFQNMRFVNREREKRRRERRWKGERERESFADYSVCWLLVRVFVMVLTTSQIYLAIDIATLKNS